jgi:hypothetical protein
VALPFTLKLILRQKKELWKNQISTQAKISSLKNPLIEIDLLLLPRGQNPLSYYTL